MNKANMQDFDHNGLTFLPEDGADDQKLGIDLTGFAFDHDGDAQRVSPLDDYPSSLQSSGFLDNWVKQATGFFDSSPVFLDAPEVHNTTLCGQDADYQEQGTSKYRTSYRTKRSRPVSGTEQDVWSAAPMVDPGQLVANDSFPISEAIESYFKNSTEMSRPTQESAITQQQGSWYGGQVSSASEHIFERSPSSSTGSAAGSLSMESTRSTESSFATSVSVHNRQNSDAMEAGRLEDPHTKAPEVEDSNFAVPSPDALSPLDTDGQVKTNLGIRILGIPSQGAKTRVETQVKLTIQLVDKTTGRVIPETGYFQVNPDGSSCKVIGWRHFKIAPHLAAKSTRRKSVAADEISEREALQLHTEVICASQKTPVQACDACVIRERKRFFKRKAARTRPVRDSAASRIPNPDDPMIANQEREKIVMFSAGEVLDIPQGECEVPVRFTCYCRHHQEKIGFQLILSAVDWQGNVVAVGKTPPIMITDDHKSLTKLSATSDVGSSTKRFNHLIRRNSAEGSKASDSDMPAASTHSSSVKARRKGATTPKSLAMTPLIPTLFSLPTGDTGMKLEGTETTTTASTNHSVLSDGFTPVSSTSHTAPWLPTPINSPPALQDSPMAAILSGLEAANADMTGWNGNHQWTVPDDPASSHGRVPWDMSTNFLDRARVASDHSGGQNGNIYLKRPASVPNVSALSNAYLPLDTGRMNPAVMSALIPGEGPTSGGQPISIIGSNLTPDLTVMFGDVPAVTLTSVNPSSMVVWLPPSPAPGPVIVTFKDYPMQMAQDGHGGIQIFTYQDRSDRDLMQLALQVIGVSMTGQLQDANQIAQRILASGQAGEEGKSRDMTYNEDFLMSDANIVAQMCTGKTNNFEALVIQSLGLLDRSADRAKSINLQNQRGQTLLHLAAHLGFHRLCSTLVNRHIKLAVQDNNGFTALHLAAWAGKIEVVKILREAGLADDLCAREGNLAIDLAREQGHRNVWRLLRRSWEFTGGKTSPASRPTSQRRHSSTRSIESVSSHDLSAASSDSETEELVWIGYEGGDDLSSDELSDGSAPVSENIEQESERWRLHRSPSMTNLDREGVPTVYSRRPSVVRALSQDDSRVKPDLHAPSNARQQDLAKASALWLQQTFSALSGKRTPDNSQQTGSLRVKRLSSDRLSGPKRPLSREDLADDHTGSSPDDHIPSDHSDSFIDISSRLRSKETTLPRSMEPHHTRHQSPTTRKSGMWLRSIRADRMLWLFHVPILRKSLLVVNIRHPS